MLDENDCLIFIAAIFSMNMLALVPVIDAIDLFPDAEAKNANPKNPNHKRGHGHL